MTLEATTLERALPPTSAPRAHGAPNATGEAAPRPAGRTLSRVLAALGLIAALASPFARGAWTSSRAVPVSWERASVRPLAQTAIASGAFKYMKAAALSPELLGRVRAIHVEKGQVVERGDVVLTLDAEALQAEVREQRAAVAVQRMAARERERALAQAERDLATATHLTETGALSQNKLNDARDQRDRAAIALAESQEQQKQVEASLGRSIEQMAKATIRAPSAGTVISVDIKVGETAVPSVNGGPGSSLMTIADPDSFIAEIQVDEADIPRVRVGQPVQIFTSALPGQPVAARVSSIPLTAVEKGTRAGVLALGAGRASAYAVEAKLVDPTPEALRPGMTCRAEIETSALAPQVTVPVQAVLSESASGRGDASRAAAGERSKRHVFVVENGRARRRAVVTGASDDRYIQILEGLRADERVIVGPYKTLRALRAEQEVSHAQD